MTIASQVKPREPNDADFEANLAALGWLRADMLRFAKLQLGNNDAAEDMVQEAMESALRHLNGFSARSSLKTWVFSILKNKIIDHLRQAKRTINFSSLTRDDDKNDGSVESLFSETGRWRAGPRPTSWPSPDEAVESKQFWVVFEICLDLLPPKAGKIFMMREFLGFESDEICSRLGLTTSNLHVILHRSRLKLRGCLETGWVRAGARPC